GAPRGLARDLGPLCGPHGPGRLDGLTTTGLLTLSSLSLAAPMGALRSLRPLESAIAPNEPHDLRRVVELVDSLAQLDALTFRVVSVCQRAALMPDEQLRGAFGDLRGLHGLSEGVAQRVKHLPLFT